MSYKDSAKENVAKELRRFVLMRGGADTLDVVWYKEVDTIRNIMLSSDISASIEKMRREITIMHPVYPNYPDGFIVQAGSPLIESIKYEIPFRDIIARVDEAEYNGYKPTGIELIMKANLGNIYGLPTRLKLIEDE